jgi:hypothetical protein
VVEIDDQSGKAKSIKRLKIDLKKNDKTGNWEKELL